MSISIIMHILWYDPLKVIQHIRTEFHQPPFKYEMSFCSSEAPFKKDKHCIKKKNDKAAREIEKKKPTKTYFVIERTTHGQFIRLQRRHNSSLEGCFFHHSLSHSSLLQQRALSC